MALVPVENNTFHLVTQITKNMSTGESHKGYLPIPDFQFYKYVVAGVLF
jgi:hypothetical protein